MTVFPFQIGEVTGLYNRVMKSRSRGSDIDAPERVDVVTISSEGKRQRVINETQAAVLARIKGGE
ncbi:MAG: hypothetical protein ACXWW2_10285 [Candidatus Deferrimicrobiaceae bacterium]